VYLTSNKVNLDDTDSLLELAHSAQAHSCWTSGPVWQGNPRGIRGGFAKTLPRLQAIGETSGVVEGSRPSLPLARPLAPSPPAFSPPATDGAHRAGSQPRLSSRTSSLPSPGRRRALLAVAPPRPSRSTGTRPARGGAETCPGQETVPCYTGEFPELTLVSVPPRSSGSEELN
jgi:hypothetical protein